MEAAISESATVGISVPADIVERVDAIAALRHVGRDRAMVDLMRDAIAAWKSEDPLRRLMPKIAMQDLFALEEWRSHSPEAPDGLWYKDFGSFKLCGEGQYPKTFLLKGQVARGREIE